MGIDLRVHIKLKEGAALPVCSLLDEEDCVSDSFDKWIECELDNAPTEATHVYDSLHRLYTQGYERGNWFMISDFLLRLFYNKDILKIWYDGDAGCPCDDREMNSERFVAITQFFIEDAKRQTRRCP